MIKLINKHLRNKKGFTLVELIAVLAVLGIISAIAIPNFIGVQEDAKVKADYATATSIVKAARLQHTVNGKVLEDEDDDPLTSTNKAVYSEAIDSDYFESGVTPQSAPTGNFMLSYDAGKYIVEWGSETYTEGDSIN